MGMFDQVKKAAQDAGNKVKDSAQKFKDDLKEQEAKNEELKSLPMEERVKLRPEGVKYCLINASGKILDVYENKAVFTSTKSTSTLVTSVVFMDSQMSQGEKTIYYKDALGVQFKPSSITDGFIQIETASGNMTSSGSQYGSENSFNFSSTLNAEAETVANYLKQRIDEIKSGADAPAVVQAAASPADELKKLKELLDMEIITQDEFDDKKKELLAKM